ncbi:hypothetical protein, partial [Gemmatimonas sp.]|uniref:hypothetical protein n=1 Tax=Gemmatimonas sp. TaxID=1962908 RepID=UPI003563B743
RRVSAPWYYGRHSPRPDRWDRGNAGVHYQEKPLLFFASFANSAPFALKSTLSIVSDIRPQAVPLLQNCTQREGRREREEREEQQ